MKWSEFILFYLLIAIIFLIALIDIAGVIVVAFIIAQEWETLTPEILELSGLSLVLIAADGICIRSVFKQRIHQSNKKV